MYKKIFSLIFFVLLLGIIAGCSGSPGGGYPGTGQPGTPGYATGTVHGRVTDYDTAQPLENAEIAVDSGQGATSQSDGTFTITDVPSGYRFITASRENYYSSTNLAYISGDQINNVSINLRSSGTTVPPDDPGEPPAGSIDVYAVLVGIEDYPGSSYDLSYCVDDANDLKQALQNSASWSNSKIVTLTNSNAPKAKIQSEVQEAKTALKNDGLFVFLYSGHGTNDGNTGYIVPYDGINDSSKLLSEDELETILSSFSSTVKKLVLIDSCNSGHFIDQRMYKTGTGKIKFAAIHGANPVFYGEGLDKSLNSIPNTICLTACAGSETAQESSSLQNGIFTYYIVEGFGNASTIGPADTNNSRSISAEEVYNYTAPRASNYNPGQNAKIKDNYSGDLLIKN